MTDRGHWLHNLEGRLEMRLGMSLSLDRGQRRRSPGAILLSAAGYQIDGNTWSGTGAIAPVRGSGTSAATSVIKSGDDFVMNGTGSRITGPSTTIPAITATTGDLTILMDFETTDIAQSAGTRIWSAESEFGGGCAITLDGTEIAALCGGADGDVTVARAAAFTSGTRVWLALVKSGATVNLWTSAAGFTTAADTTSVGTITSQPSTTGALTYTSSGFGDFVFRHQVQWAAALDADSLTTVVEELGA